MDDVQKLIAIEEIKKTKYRYMRAVDTKDRNLLIDIAHPDIEVDLRQAAADPNTGAYLPLPGASASADAGNSPGIIRGRDQFADMISILAPTITVHHASNPDIEIASENTATGTWAFMDIIKIKDQSASPKQLHGWGFYYDTYEKTEGRWRIKSMKITRQIVDVS